MSEPYAPPGTRSSLVPLIAARVRGPEVGRVKGWRSRSHATRPKGAPLTRPADPGYWPRQGGQTPTRVHLPAVTEESVRRVRSDLRVTQRR